VLRLPALFVLFAYPLPLVLVNQIIYPLQLAVTAAAAGMLDLLGFQVAHAGDRVAFNGALFQVIETCSGLRGTATIVMASVLYVELFHESRLRSALIVAGAPVIGLVTNQIRVLTIMFNPYSQIAAVHSAQGLVMIVVAVLLLAVWDSLLGRLLPSPTPRAPRRLPPRTSLPLLRLAVLAGVTLALAAASLVVEPWTTPRPRVQPLSSIQVRDLGAVESLPIDKQFLGSTAFSEWVHRAYGEGDERVSLFLGGDDRSSGGLRMLSHKTAVLESAWEVEGHGRTRLASGREVEWLELRSGSRRQLVWRWHEGTAGRAEETLRALLATERSPLRSDGRAVVVRLSTPLGDGLVDRQAAVGRLEGLAAQVEEQLDRILAPPA
jgi:exosortase/archaeosortase family protein